MLPILMFLALAVFVIGVSFYGWWTDPAVQYQRELRAIQASMRRMQIIIGEQLIPAFQSMVPAVNAAAAATRRLTLALHASRVTDPGASVWPEG